MDGEAERMANFNWIKARAECSLTQVLRQLELGARNDVDTANAQRMAEDRHKFSISASAGRFSVTRESSRALPLSVDFSSEGDEIVVCAGNEIILKATIALNYEGRCILRVDNEELEQWQVRRMALEDLFFGEGGRPMAIASQ